MSNLMSVKKVGSTSMLWGEFFGTVFALEWRFFLEREWNWKWIRFDTILLLEIFHWTRWLPNESDGGFLGLLFAHNPFHILRMKTSSPEDWWKSFNFQWSLKLKWDHKKQTPCTPRWCRLSFSLEQNDLGQCSHWNGVSFWKNNKIKIEV